jgi:hypothetical protein
MGRLYVPVREAGPLAMRIRLQAVGTRRLTVYVNGQMLPEGVELAEGNAFRDYDVAIPAERVQAGDNQIQLSFGGTVRVGEEDVSVAVSSVRIAAGRAIAEDPAFVAPEQGALVSQIEVGGIERRALSVRAPTTATYHVQVPEGGRFVFGVGAEGSAAAGRARVVVQPEGGAASELYSAALTNRWDDQSLDLGAFAGQIVRLDLVVEGAGAGRVAWSAPAIMVPPPQVAELRTVRNVVVVLIDTLRASKLRPWNPRTRVRTPVLDRLASEGTVFERASSQENWTKPSVASVLTGLTPATHGAKISLDARRPGWVIGQAANCLRQGMPKATRITCLPLNWAS